MIVHKKTATCYFMDSDTEKQFPSIEEARVAAEAYCGNRSSAKPVDGTWLYGPGDGTTSVMVRRDFEFVD